MIVAAVVFALTLMLTYAASIYARVLARDQTSDEDLAGRNLSRWLIGLSAATTGNSGFIVTAAVGLGYTGGVQWIMLPVAWLLGDLVFWALFPERLNARARAIGAVTLTELITSGIGKSLSRVIAWVVGLLLVICLSAYTSAQWLAGEKFLSTAFSIPLGAAAVLFGLTIVIYSSIGNFRGSVYADTVQAVIRILGTVIALATVAWIATSKQPAFWQNIAGAGPSFLHPFPQGGVLLPLAFVVGYAAAAIGFGLGQPQIATRYMAGATPEETRAARWIYISFLHGTWISMTLFGVLLRGVLPGIADPEAGLSVFIVATLSSVAAGIIFADVFATIASTANGILIAIGQIIRRDLLGPVLGDKSFSLMVMSFVTLIVGVATIALSFIVQGNVFSIAVASVSQVGAGLAGPVMIKVFSWRHTGPSMLAAILVGIISGLTWAWLGYSSVMNEAAVGIVISILVNALVARLGGQQVVSQTSGPDRTEFSGARSPASPAISGNDHNLGLEPTA